MGIIPTPGNLVAIVQILVLHFTNCESSDNLGLAQSPLLFRLSSVQSQVGAKDIIYESFYTVSAEPLR